ncbi:ABC transporter substrate-binding protein [soil metagenome]
MRIADPGSVLIARQLYEGLTRWDPVAEEVKPAAARSWSTSRDGRTFTFRLRRGMTFHDGTRVTAEDFRYAFDRIAFKGNASDLAYTLERVDGFAAVNRRGTKRHLAGITTPNDHTLRFSLARPTLDLPTVLTHPGLVPLPKRAVRRYDEFVARPIGNGSFQMAAGWTGSGPVVLEAFDGAIDVPEVEVIRFVPFDDAAVSWIPFTEERLDVAEVPAGQIASAAEEFGDRGYLPLLAGLYFGFQLESPPFREQELREAISRAIDRKSIAREIFSGTLEAPRGIVPDGMPGFSADACPELCSHAPKAARRLVKRIPATRRKVTIDFDRDMLQARVARAVKRDLEGAGLQVKLRPTPIERYLERLAAGKASMYRFGWIAQFPAPSVFLSELFRSDSPDNHSGFASPRIDSLLRRAQAQADEHKRVELWRRAEKLILRRVPVVPIGSFTMHWAAQPRVKEIFFDVMGGFDAATVSLGG